MEKYLQHDVVQYYYQYAKNSSKSLRMLKTPKEMGKVT